MFAKLDNTQDMEDDELRPLKISIHTVEMGPGAIHVPGLPGVWPYTCEEHRTKLIRYLQRQVDRMLNSAAAEFLVYNHGQPNSAPTHQLEVLVPGHVHAAVMAYFDWG